MTSSRKVRTIRITLIDEKERLIQEEKKKLKEDTYKFLDWQKEV